MALIKDKTSVATVHLLPRVERKRYDNEYTRARRSVLIYLMTYIQRVHAHVEVIYTCIHSDMYYYIKVV